MFFVLVKQTISPKSLPNKINLLKQMFIDIHEEKEKYRMMYENLFNYVKQVNNNQFGRKSERIQDGQQVFPFVQVIEDARKEIGHRESAVKPASKNGNGHGRRIIPLDSKCVEQVIDVPSKERKCPCCKKQMEKIGEDKTKYFEHVPETLSTVVIRRAKYACRDCGEGVLMANLPPRPIRRGIAGPGLLAKTVVSKYCDHLPLYRQSQMLKRHGINISVSTMCGWIEKLADLVKPLYNEMEKNVLQSEVIHTDDTPVPMMVDAVKHKTKKSRFWVYVGKENTVFKHTDTREKKHPEEALHGYNGAVQADGFKGYASVCEKEEITLAGCWAHARRKYYVARDLEPAIGYTVLAHITGLYEIERKIKRLDRKPTATQISAIRKKLALPILKSMNKWVQKKKKGILPRSPMGKAITYMKNQWKALNEYIYNGNLDIDNNSAERPLRPVAIGRKNYMFVGSEEGGERAAIMYTLIISCKQNGVEPYQYLRDIFQRILTHPPDKISELIPSSWKKKFLPLLSSADKKPDTS
jgi:transposase